MDYKKKYLKYKSKYEFLKMQFGSALQAEIVDVRLGNLLHRGLPNKGNTCFLNVVILLLASINEFTPEMMQSSISRDQLNESLYTPADKLGIRSKENKEFLLYNTVILRDLLLYVTYPDIDGGPYTRIKKLMRIPNESPVSTFLRNGVCSYNKTTGGEALDSFNNIIEKLKLYILLNKLLLFDIITDKSCDPVKELSHTDKQRIVNNYYLNLQISESPVPYYMGDQIKLFTTPVNIGNEIEICRPSDYIEVNVITNTKKYFLINLNRSTDTMDSSRMGKSKILEFNDINIDGKKYSLLGVIIMIPGKRVNHYVYYYSLKNCIFNDDEEISFTDMYDIQTIFNVSQSLHNFIANNGVMFLYNS